MRLGSKATNLPPGRRMRNTSAAQRKGSGKWWTSPLLFWDDFKKDGELGPEAANQKPISSLALKQTIAGGGSADFTLLLAWHWGR